MFLIPGSNGCNKKLVEWGKAAGILKHVTWSYARLSFSILLQDENVDDATVAALLGHTTTTQVRRRYKRCRPKDESATISKLPSPDLSQYFLHLPEGEKQE
jgi:integrase